MAILEPIGIGIALNVAIAFSATVRGVRERLKRHDIHLKRHLSPHLDHENTLLEDRFFKVGFSNGVI